MRGPRHLQHEVPQCSCPGLARGFSQHEVHAAELGLLRPRVKLAEEPPYLRLLPDLAFDKFIQDVCEPRAAASGGAEDPDHVLRVDARRLLAPFKATSQPGASEARSMVQACRAEIYVPKCRSALYRPLYGREPKQLRGLLGDGRSKGVHYVSKVCSAIWGPSRRVVFSLFTEVPRETVWKIAGGDGLHIFCSAKRH